jgi:OPA family glycerol-3-phosphate transporter-like MFS transporter 3
MANWFPKKNRGFLVGLWATCPNVGNIIGMQISAFILRLYDGKWEYLMFLIGIVFCLYSLVLFFFLIPDPQDIGLSINENPLLTE